MKFSISFQVEGDPRPKEGINLLDRVRKVANWAVPADMVRTGDFEVDKPFQRRSGGIITKEITEEDARHIRLFAERTELKVRITPEHFLSMAEEKIRYKESENAYNRYFIACFVLPGSALDDYIIRIREDRNLQKEMVTE